MLNWKVTPILSHLEEKKFISNSSLYDWRAPLTDLFLNDVGQ